MALTGDEEQQAAPVIPLAGYSEEAARLDNVYDSLNAVAEILLTVHSSKKTKPRQNRAPRPETASQRIKRRRAMEKLTAIEEKMTGGR